MKKIHLVLSVAVSTLLCQSVQAAVFTTAQMIGLQTGNLGADATTGTLENWGNNTGNVRVTNGLPSLELTNLNGQGYFVESAGTRAFTATNVGLNVRNQFVPASTFNGDPRTNLYFSWLYRFRDASLLQKDTNGAPIVINRLNTGNSGTTLAQHFDLLARDAGGGNIQIGIAKPPFVTLAVTNWATTNITAGQTFLVVVRAQLISSTLSNINGVTGNSNNVYELWINPPREYLGTNEDNVPTNYISASIGTNGSDGIEAVGSGPGRLVFGHGAFAEFDELRVASTWAEVTPPFGQCIPASVAISPTNRTHSAEINSTFEVLVGGTTAPTYQWQRSTNGGTTWSNIPDADAFSYTTPNLAIGDSGSQYRAIVSAGCDLSSATSGVATVTLTNPIVTPNGVVMNDTFTDPELGFDSRSNLPLTSSNSVWFALNTDALTAFEQGGNMVGTNGASASLWVGYFADETNGPVHLAVGKQIKVTLPFIPEDFSQFTGNGNVRWGLLDYFDGGTRINLDGVGGSAGNGTGVRGYMLSLDFGTNFVDNTPLSLLARNFLPSANLLGSSGDYVELGEGGPIGGAYSNTTAFVSTTNYTLVFTVARTAVDTVFVTTAITGGGLNLSHTAVDSTYAYHRFDAFGIRPANEQTTADKFTFPEFIVEVSDAVVPSSTLNIQRSGTNVILSWTNPVFRLQQSTNNLVSGPYEDVGGAGNVSPYTNNIGTLPTYYRLVYP